MKKFLMLSFVGALCAFAFQFNSKPESTVSAFVSTESAKGMVPVAESDLRAASAKAIKLVQHTQGVWYQKETCTSCHHQLLPQITLKLARERGVPVDDKLAQETISSAFAYLKDLDTSVQGYDYIDVIANAWQLVAANEAGIGANPVTASEAQFIASRQSDDGSWPTIDARPPQSYSTFTTTAVSARALQLYLPDRLIREKQTRLRMAREWLLKSQPRVIEDRVFQLRGLSWTGADNAAVAKAARQLLAEQREDGGWSQLPRLASDAYATGEVLVALHEAGGVSTNDSAYQRGLRFLINSQEADGSWRVRSRLNPPAPLSPPYVNLEFPPFNHDQFISLMATTWAAAALLEAVPRASGAVKSYDASTLKPVEQGEWVQVALSGSAAQLKKILDSGMKADSRTEAGTTALMLAARDPEKVKLLISRGADVNARSSAGITPLMVAARYRGNAEVVALLLKHGAKPNSEKGIEVRNDSSALFFAVMAGDLQTLATLVNAGARVDVKMRVLGTIPSSPLVNAVFLGDAKVVDFLIQKGADANETDDDKISMLAWATISNHVEVMQTLISRGARLNPVDKYGMTPLLYAASIDFGDTAALEKLISGGADIGAKTKEGLSALDLARKYHHEAIASVLGARTASR